MKSLEWIKIENTFLLQRHQVSWWQAYQQSSLFEVLLAPRFCASPIEYSISIITTSISHQSAEIKLIILTSSKMAWLQLLWKYSHFRACREELRVNHHQSSQWKWLFVHGLLSYSFAIVEIATGVIISDSSDNSK